MFLPSLLFSLLTAGAVWLMSRRHPARDPRVTGAALVLLVLLPLLNFLPKFSVSLPAVSVTAASTSWIFLGWLVGFSLFALRALINYRAMARWKKQSSTYDLSSLLEETKTQLEFTKNVHIRLHPELESPVVAGLFTPTIYLPKTCRNWSQKTLRMALLHELSHLQRRDLWMATLAYFACLLHWFNPAVWWMRKTFLTQCEYACDAHLINRGADPKTYAHALCDVAESTTKPPLALAMAGHIPLRERIQYIASPTHHRSLLLVLFVLTTSLPAIAMSVVRFAPEVMPHYSDAEIELRFNASPFPGDQ